MEKKNSPRFFLIRKYSTSAHLILKCFINQMKEFGQEWTEKTAVCRITREQRGFEGNPKRMRFVCWTSFVRYKVVLCFCSAVVISTKYIFNSWSYARILHSGASISRRIFSIWANRCRSGLTVTGTNWELFRGIRPWTVNWLWPSILAPFVVMFTRKYECVY